MTESAVGPYRVIRPLGAGGMGEVLLCHDGRLDRKVALKRLTAISTDHDGLREQILREARAAARLNHPNIAAVYDVIEQDDRAFIVMEYVEGESLATCLARERLSIDRIVAIGRQLASALSAAHAEGVIHRDLKPANVQLTRSGSIKVLDFGVARLMSRMAAPDATTASAPTAAPEVAGNPGTPAYMAPEQLVHGHADARSDVYSLGVILFEMATGRRPHQQDDVIALAVAVAGSDAPAARDVDARVPASLSAVVARALGRDPSQRYQTARELEAALEEGATGSATGPTWPRWWKVAAVLVVLAAAGGVAVPSLLVRAGWLRNQASATRSSIVAILPVLNPSGDPQAEYLGAGFASLMAENLRSIPGLTVLSRASTAGYAAERRGDLSGLQREHVAEYVVDLTMKTARPTPQLIVRLRRPAVTVPVWEQTLSGEGIDVERSLLEGIGRALERHDALHRPMTDAEWARLRKVPTPSSEALMAYSEARALLDRTDLAGNLDKAIGRLDAAIAADGAFALAHAALGDAYRRRYEQAKDTAAAERAAAAIMEAIRLDPEQPVVYQSLGNLQLLTGKYEDATASLTRAIAIQPDDDESHRLLGRVRSERGDVDGAVAELREAIRLRPTNWNHHNTLGFILYRAGRYQEALAAYRRTTELQPTYAGAFANLGTILFLLGDLPQAIGYYEHAVRLGPVPSAYSNLGMAYYNAERYADALTAYRDALTLDPNSVLNHRNLGDVYRRIGQRTNARAAYERAIGVANALLKVNARDAGVISLLALCEAKLGRTVQANRHAAEALVLAPTNRDALQRSAEVHALVGNPGAALHDLAGAIRSGYGRRQARENEEFASLRHLPTFQQLVADRKENR